MVTPFSEIGENEYLDPRTAQVAIVDHVKQVRSVVSMSIEAVHLQDLWCPSNSSLNVLGNWGWKE